MAEAFRIQHSMSLSMRAANPAKSSHSPVQSLTCDREAATMNVCVGPLSFGRTPASSVKSHFKAA
jgi:hypothetical protein